MLGEALRLVRVYHQLSQTQLSYKLAVSNSYLSEIESGKKTPSLDILQKYSTCFSIPVSSLMFFSENMATAGVTAPLRRHTAKQVLSLLRWYESRLKKKNVVMAGD